jgi:arylsulfatase A-like enzyme
MVALAPVDDLVGDIHERLDALDETRDTLVIFMSDQGYMWGEHHREGKRLPYLEAGRIPLLMSWPGHLDEGVTDGRLVANIDIAPTIAEAVGLDDPVDGLSLLGSARREALLLEYFKDPRRGVLPAWSSLVTERYQYIEYYDERERTIAREYYDLVLDPWELSNLAHEDHARELQLHMLGRALRDAAACAGSGCVL